VGVRCGRISSLVEEWGTGDQAMSRIYRRGKVYWARAQRGNIEHRRSLKTSNRSIAKKRLAAWLGELDAIAWGDKPRRSYVEAEEKFIREHLTTIKPKSATRYGVSLVHLSEHFSGKMLHQITSGALSEFETRRRSAGVSNSTIRRDLSCLSSLLTSCIDWEWMDEGTNIVPGYLRRRSKRGLKEGVARTRYLTPEEETRLIASATPLGALNKAGRSLGKVTVVREAIAVAIDTGLRLNEQLSMTWDQIDLAQGIIMTTTMTKSGRPRVVPLPERSRTILGTLPRYIDSDFVFVNPATGTRFVTLQKGLKAAARRAGITNLEWHDLRRTAGCRWLQRDRKSLAEVCILLGHSSVKVTEERYAFLEAEAVAMSISGGTKPGTGTADSATIIQINQKVA
jgi:integrase/recombinase XerD